MQGLEEVGSGVRAFVKESSGSCNVFIHTLLGSV